MPEEIKKSESIGVEHEYVDLDVEEISVVDVPANTKEFAVIKCIGETKEEPMAQETVEKKSTDQSAKVDEVPVDVASENEGAAIEQVLTQLDSIEKTVKDFVSSEDNNDETESEEGEVEKAEDQEDTPENIFQKALEASGVKGKDLETAMSKYRKVCACKTEKSSSEEEQVTTEAPDLADQLFEMTRKAKAITPSRFEAIKQMQEILTKLIKEIETIPEGKSPKIKVPSNASFGNSGIKGVMKALSEVTKNLGALSETIKKNSEKISKIEKAQKPTTSLGDDEPVEKSGNEDFWTGAI